jgi:hypothetical protein
MTARIVEAEAVLKAADEWVAAQEALVAARQICHETAVEEEPPMSRVLGWSWP